MKILILSLLALSTMQPTHLNNPDARDSSELSEKKGSWKSLFDGKTTKGWHSYGRPEAGKAWKAENGVLHLDAASKSSGAEGGDLVTDQDYSDFHLKLDWKISAKGNSGIIFYVKEDPSSYPNTFNTGPEMQVLDNAGHPDAKIHKHRAGDLYDLIPSIEETVKPAGEWNQAEIISQKGRLEFYLNGTKVVSTTLWDENWKNLVAGSKFASMPGFGTFKFGKIALQDHGDEVWYRNIRIRKL